MMRKFPDLGSPLKLVFAQRRAVVRQPAFL